jgi:membrane-associated phospholipid phosphatase
MSTRRRRAPDGMYGSLRRLTWRIAERTNLSRAIVVLLAGAAMVVVAASVGFTALLDDVMEGNGITGADAAVQRFVLDHRSAWMNDVFRALTWLGSVAVVAPLVAVAVVVLVRRRERLLAFGVIVATVGTAVLVQVTKALVDRPRPPLVSRLVSAPGAAFPSGHSAQAVACYGALAWVLTRSTASRAVHIVAWSTAVAIAFLVGLSRVYLGVHWVSDVVSGWFVGAAWLTVTIAVCELIRELRAQRTTRV